MSTSTTSLVRPSSDSKLTSTLQRQNSLPSAVSSALLPKPGLTPRKDAPATPKQSSSPAPATPGQWQHPRMDEVVRRQSKTNFDNSNVKLIATNVFIIAATFALSKLVDSTLPRNWIQATQPYDTYTLLAIRAFLSFNIIIALLPLFRDPDTCEDIPLTPAQRQLLGLPPMTRSATPQEESQWVTPPRYSRSLNGTPRSAASSARGTAGSPLSGRGTPLDMSMGARGSPSGSQFGSAQKHSPSSYTPRDEGERRRLSYSGARNSSPLGVSESDGMSSIGTPTKTNRASVGLNSKWLYNKGRGSPNTWGTGSVFT